MKYSIKLVLCGLGAAIVAAGAWFFYRISHPPSIEAYRDRMLAPAGRAAGLRVTFLGVSTLLFDDGEHALLTDGFFTRPDRQTVFFGKVAPDPDLIARALERAGIRRLDAVFVAHSHYDHAMDAPEVAKRTGALVIGSESTANVARGWGLPEERIRIAHGGERIDIGRFQVTLVGSRHAPTGFTGGEIAAPLVPPVRAMRYLEGGSFSLLIAHDGKTMLVQSSAGFADHALRGRRAEVVFLGIGALGKQSADYRSAYWNETVQAVGARRVIPIHWDDFTQPLAQPLVPIPVPFDDFEKTMAFVGARARQDGIEVRFAPAWEKVDPFAGL